MDEDLQNRKRRAAESGSRKELLIEFLHAGRLNDYLENGGVFEEYLSQGGKWIELYYDKERSSDPEEIIPSIRLHNVQYKGELRVLAFSKTPVPVHPPDIREMYAAFRFIASVMTNGVQGRQDQDGVFTVAIRKTLEKMCAGTVNTRLFPAGEVEFEYLRSSRHREKFMHLGGKCRAFRALPSQTKNDIVKLFGAQDERELVGTLRLLSGRYENRLIIGEPKSHPRYLNLLNELPLATVLAAQKIESPCCSFEDHSANEFYANQPRWASIFEGGWGYDSRLGDFMLYTITHLTNREAEQNI